MTSIEVQKLISAFNKILKDEHEIMKDTPIGDFKGVRLEADEYKIIKPFLFLKKKITYQIGDVVITTEGPLNTSLVYTDDYALISIPDKEMPFLFDALKIILQREQYGYHTKLKKYSKGVGDG